LREWRLQLKVKDTGLGTKQVSPTKNDAALKGLFL